MADNKGGFVGAAVIGGVVGSLLTAAALVFAAPQLLGPRIVREGLMREPTLLLDGQQALRRAQAIQAIEPIRAQLETPFASAWAGAKDADVTIVYFYDYACGYCRQVNPTIDRLLAEDKKLRVVYRDMPILSQDSLVAAHVSLAAARAGKFRTFHDDLFAAGRPTAANLEKVAKAVGITPEMASDPAFEGEIRRNLQWAEALGASGTPLFIIGDSIVNAAVPYEELKQAVAEARAAKAA